MAVMEEWKRILGAACGAFEILHLVTVSDSLGTYPTLVAGSLNAYSMLESGRWRLVDQAWFCFFNEQAVVNIRSHITVMRARASVVSDLVYTT